MYYIIKQDSNYEKIHIIYSHQLRFLKEGAYFNPPQKADLGYTNYISINAQSCVEMCVLPSNIK